MIENLSKKLADYVENHTSGESSLLGKVNRETYEQVLMPRMLSGHLQGRILSLLSRLIQPKFILEIGTFTGYSALCLAEGLAEGGRILTIDINEELEARTRRYLESSKFTSSIDFVIGDALRIVEDVTQPIDLAFIDADKENYLKYYNLVLPRLRHGGLIIADNVLWSGKVIDDTMKADLETAALKAFNDFVHEDDSVENVLLPVRDGLMLIYKI